MLVSLIHLFVWISAVKQIITKIKDLDNKLKRRELLNTKMKDMRSIAKEVNTEMEKTRSIVKQVTAEMRRKTKR